MKKKLLLSSVAALTLFAAYNATSAAEYGKFGEPVETTKQLPNVDTIEKAQTREEIQAELTRVSERQTEVNALRLLNLELKNAKEGETLAKSEWEKAVQAYKDAVEAYKAAFDTQYDAAAQLEKLEDLKAAELDRDSYDKDQLRTKNADLATAKEDLENKVEALEVAQGALDLHLAKTPVAGSRPETLKEFGIEKIRLEGELQKAKADKVKAENKVSSLSSQVSELTAAIEKHKDVVAALDKAINALNVVVGDPNAEGNTGSVRGVLVASLEENVNIKHEEEKLAQQYYIRATSFAKNKQAEFDGQLAKTKEVYAKQNVEFKLEVVLGTEEPSKTFVKSFGWNQNEKGEWTYVLNSDGKLAEGWVNDAGSWYYLDPATHVMKKWWVQVDGTWYYLNGSGVMQTGWLNDNGTWYYLEASGALKVNQWFEVGGKWYHVDPSGALSVNTTVDGYNVNENGEWV